jgi:death on curing protein
VRYLTLAEAIVVAEVVTGLDAQAIVKASRLDLLDSALHAPQAGFGRSGLLP